MLEVLSASATWLKLNLKLWFQSNLYEWNSNFKMLNNLVELNTVIHSLWMVFQQTIGIEVQNSAMIGALKTIIKLTWWPTVFRFNNIQYVIEAFPFKVDDGRLCSPGPFLQTPPLSRYWSFSMCVSPCHHHFGDWPLKLWFEPRPTFGHLY